VLKTSNIERNRDVTLKLSISTDRTT